MAILKIEDYDFDIGSNPIPITKKAFSIEDFSIRNISFSEKITLPENHDTRLLFKRPAWLNIQANKFGRYYNFSYKDASTVLFNGIAKLISTNSEIEIQLIDSAKELFDNLDESIKKLDFEADDFVFSVAEYDLKKIQNPSVWIWAAVSMHTLRKTNNTIFAGGAASAKLKFSRPLFNQTRIIEKIFAVNKWQFSKNYDLNEIEDLAFSSNHSAFYVTSYQKKLTQTINNPGANITNLSTNDFEFGTISLANTINVGKTTTIFRIRGEITATENSTLKITGVSSPLGTDELEQVFEIKKGKFSYDYTSEEFKTEENNNTISFFVETTGQVDFNNTLLYTIIEEQDLGTLSSNLLQGYLVKVYDNLIDVPQIELLKNWFNMFGAFFISDNFRKSLKVYNFNILDKNNSLNWSEKFISESEIISTADFLNKENYYKYTNDETVNSELGSGFFKTENLTLPAEGTIIENYFGASADVEIDSVKLADFNIYDNDKRINEINPRILKVNYIPVKLATAAIFQEINGANILLNYWQNITESLLNPYIVQAKFNLNRSDFFQFDFTKPVYIEKFKSNFIVLEINSYIKGKPTSVKLLKFR